MLDKAAAVVLFLIRAFLEGSSPRLMRCMLVGRPVGCRQLRGNQPGAGNGSGLRPRRLVIYTRGGRQLFSGFVPKGFGARSGVDTVKYKMAPHNPPPKKCRLIFLCCVCVECIGSLRRAHCGAPRPIANHEHAFFSPQKLSATQHKC